MSDFSDSDIETEALNDNFTKAAEQIQRTHNILPPDDLLELYALYKQSTIGACNTAKPNIFSMQARAKWSAWNDLGTMGMNEAQYKYVEKVKKLDPKWYAALEKGAKFKSPNSWVVHSVEKPPEDLEMKAEHEKNAFDYVKEANLVRLKEVLSSDDLQRLDEQGMGLIHWATDRNATDILHWLLSAGADVNQRDAEQQTALHYASCCGHLDCIRVLLDFKADKQLTDADGQTCLDVAENDVVRELLIAS